MVERDGRRSGGAVLGDVVRRHRGALAASAAAALAWQLTIIAAPIVLGWTVDRGVERGLVDAALVGGVVLVLLGSAEAGFDAVRHRLENRVAVDVAADLRRHVAAAALTFDDADRSSFPDGDVVARATSDVDAVAGAVDSFGYTVAFALSIPIVIVLVARLDLALAGVVTLAVLAVTVSVRLTSRRYEVRSIAVQEAIGATVARTQQLIRNALAIRGLGGEAACVDALARDSAEVAAASRRMARLSLVFEPWLQFVSVAVAASALWLAGERVVAGDLGLGDAVAAIGLALVLVGPVRELADWVIGIRIVHASARRVGELPTRPPRTLGRTVAGPAIEAHGVVVDVAGERLVGGADLVVRRGELHVLDGPVGAGKSTLLRTVAGRRAPSAGTVATTAPALLLDADPRLVAGSIADNVRLGRPDAGDDEVRAALALVDGADLLAGHALDESLADGGADLSGGQRQRLAVARAVVAGFEVLLLDNALSAVEPARETTIVERLRNSRTVVAVTTNAAVRAAADATTTIVPPR